MSVDAVMLMYVMDVDVCEECAWSGCGEDGMEVDSQVRWTSQ